MSNLRVVYDNAADTSTLTASTTSGTLVAANLLTDIKSEIYRSASSGAGVSATATLTLTWPANKTIGCVALPFATLTGTATIRVRGYTNVNAVVGTDTAQVDSGVDTAVLGSLYVPTGGVNAYAFGGSNYVVNWIPRTAVRKIVIDLVDSGNLAGYIEASRLIVGDYWEPTYNVEAGASVSVEDRSISMRTDAGDLRSERGSMFKTMSFSMEFLTAADRNVLWNIVKRNSTFAPVLVSLTPEDSDKSSEQIYQIYGKLTRGCSLTYKFSDQFNTSLELEEV